MQLRDFFCVLYMIFSDLILGYLSLMHDFLKGSRAMCGRDDADFSFFFIVRHNLYVDFVITTDGISILVNLW